jgi:hypothetical protein
MALTTGTQAAAAWQRTAAPGSAVDESAPSRHALARRGPAVDELARSRHALARSGNVESAVRAAGGFPTQGGGARDDRASARAHDTDEGEAA